MSVMVRKCVAEITDTTSQM